MVGSRRDEAEGDPRRAPRLYVIANAVEAERLAAILDALDSEKVAAVLLREGAPSPDVQPDTLSAIIASIQSRDVAALVAGGPDLVAQTGADGVHIGDPEALGPALKRLKPASIVGAGGLRTRHDAMVAAEAGADYVMFGEPDGSGGCPALSAVLDRVGWWNEVFELPSVGYAADLDAVAEIAAAGADFVAVGEAVWRDPRGAAAALADAAARAQRVELAS